MEQTRYYCDTCETEVLKVAKITVQIYDTQAKELKLIDYRLCKDCKKRLIGLVPVVVFSSDRKPRFVSNCCNESIVDESIDMCSKCKEHCAIIKELQDDQTAKSSS